MKIGRIMRRFGWLALLLLCGAILAASQIAAQSPTAAWDSAQAASGCIPDIPSCNEPDNNSFRNACGPLATGATYTCTIASLADDDDWYYFDLCVPGTTALTLAVPAGKQYDLYLYYHNPATGNPEPVARSINPPGNNEAISVSLDRLGKYYVRVYPEPGQYDAANPYRLRVTYPICDDGNPLTCDRCEGWTCRYEPLDDGNPCTVDVCDPITKRPVHTPILCDDGNPLTCDRCEGGVCRYEPLDDGNPFTCDRCEGGRAVHEPLDDFNPTTCDRCEGGRAVHEPLDDFNPATCDRCEGGYPVREPLDDFNPATCDRCEGGRAVHEPLDDDNPATCDRCEGGRAIHEPLDDGNPATCDRCEGGHAVHEPLDDHDESTCDRCEGGYAVHVVCDDHDPTTRDRCNPVTLECEHLALPCNLAIDNFTDQNPINDLDRPSSCDTVREGCGQLRCSYVLGAFETYLRLEYSDIGRGCVARYSTTLALDATEYRILCLQVRTLTGSEDELTKTLLRLTDASGSAVSFKLTDFMPSRRPVADTLQPWQLVCVPLSAFAHGLDLARLDALSLDIVGEGTPRRGRIDVDSIRLEATNIPFFVDNFNARDGYNALGGPFVITQTGGTTLSTTYASDTPDGSAASFSISYNVSASGRAAWQTNFSPMDVREYRTLGFYAKGSTQTARVFLLDGAGGRADVDLRRYIAASQNWQWVSIPLRDFWGVEPGRLAAVGFAFQDGAGSGTLSLDNLSLGVSEALVDTFCDDDGWHNDLLGETGAFDTGACDIVIQGDTEGALILGYTVAIGCYAQYYTFIPLDLSPYRSLSFRVWGTGASLTAHISFRTDDDPIRGMDPTLEAKISDYLIAGITERIQMVRIPVWPYVVGNKLESRRGSYWALAFKGTCDISGVLWCDDLVLDTACAPLWVDNFNDANLTNALGSQWMVQGDAATRSIVARDTGGPLNEKALLFTCDVGPGTQAILYSGLKGLNLGDYARLTFDIRGAQSGEMLQICLVDGAENRGCVPITAYLGDVIRRWQNVVIPLADLRMSLDQVNRLEFVAGSADRRIAQSVYLDNIYFLCQEETQFPTPTPTPTTTPSITPSPSVTPSRGTSPTASATPRSVARLPVILR